MILAEPSTMHLSTMRCCWWFLRHKHLYVGEALAPSYHTILWPRPKLASTFRQAEGRQARTAAAPSVAGCRCCWKQMQRVLLWQSLVSVGGCGVSAGRWCGSPRGMLRGYAKLRVVHPTPVASAGPADQCAQL